MSNIYYVGTDGDVGAAGNYNTQQDGGGSPGLPTTNDDVYFINVNHALAANLTALSSIVLTSVTITCALGGRVGTTSAALSLKCGTLTVSGYSELVHISSAYTDNATPGPEIDNANFHLDAGSTVKLTAGRFRDISLSTGVQATIGESVVIADGSGMGRLWSCGANVLVETSNFSYLLRQCGGTVKTYRQIGSTGAAYQSFADGQSATLSVAGSAQAINLVCSGQSRLNWTSNGSLGGSDIILNRGCRVDTLGATGPVNLGTISIFPGASVLQRGAVEATYTPVFYGSTT